MTAIVIILIALLLASSLYLAFKCGYDKGVHDLTEEIDEGIRQIKKEKENISYSDNNNNIRNYGLREQNDSD